MKLRWPTLWEKKVRLISWGKDPSKPNYLRITPNMGFGFVTPKGGHRLAISRRRGVEWFTKGKAGRRFPDGWVRTWTLFSPMKATKASRGRRK